MPRGLDLPQNPSEWGFKGENFLLLIGIDGYHDWKPLNNAVKDLQEIRDILTAQYQFEPDHIIELLNDDATEDGIRTTLLEVKRRISENDNLVVCYSGHGYYDEDLEEGYWVPVDARKSKTSDYISNSDLLKWIRTIRTHHTLILIDSCFSGTLVSQSRSEVLSERYPSARVFASGRKELVDDGAPGQNSPFAAAVLSKLRHNNDRVLRASDLITSVSKTVESLKGQVPVEGRIKDAGDEGGEFVFHLKVSEKEIWESVVAHNAVDEYRKYCEYFPDGEFRDEAQLKIRQLTDDQSWEHAVTRNTPDAFLAYMEEHPDGKHYEQALKVLQSLEANEAWSVAIKKNTLSGYLEFLRRFPQSEMAITAKQKIDNLKHQQAGLAEDVEKEVTRITTESSEADDNRERFRTLLQDAEKLFALEKFDESAGRFREALKLHMPSLVPGAEYIRQRISEAENGLQYHQLFTDGKKAAQEGNYRLALEYFGKARTLIDSPKVNDWISHCKQKLKPPQKQSEKSDPVGQKEAVDGRPKKRRRGIVITLSIFFSVAVIVVAGVAVYNMMNSTSYDTGYTDYNYQVEEGLKDSETAYPDDDISSETSIEDGASAIYPGLVIPGDWELYDQETIYGSARQLNSLVPATYQFLADGSMSMTVSGYIYYGTWSSIGNTFYLNVNNYASYTYQVMDFSNDRLVLAANELLISGEYGNVTYTLRRMN